MNATIFERVVEFVAEMTAMFVIVVIMVPILTVVAVSVGFVKGVLETYDLIKEIYFKILSKVLDF